MKQRFSVTHHVHAARESKKSWPPKPPRPKSAATSSPTIRRSRNGRPSGLADVRQALIAAVRAGQSDAPLGLYLHIPFCRKRCKFCYFRVYTDKNAARRRDLCRGLVARDRTGQPAAGHGRPAVSLCLFRRRHAFVPQRQAAHVAGRPAAGQHQLGPCRRSHVRVRAGHALAAQDRDAPRAGHHAAQPGRRELRRRGAGRERPGPSVGRSLQVLGLDPRGRLSQREHRPDRRHGRRNVGQLERQRSAARSSSRPTA